MHPGSALASLSPRQQEILELLAKGLTNHDIARVLSIAPTTVRTHVTAILAGLDVANRTEAAAAFVAWNAGTERLATVLARPAITVRRFAAPEAGDATTKRRAAALASDLTSLFARWCWFPVIASSLAADSSTVSMTSREFGKKLGARFVVDGALRVRGRTWRLVVRVDDADDGTCLWTERYDYDQADVFDVEDSVCEAIVATAYPLVVARVFGTASASRARSGACIEAWELAHEAMELQLRRESTANASAQAQFAAAIARQNDLVLAHYGLGLASYDAVLNQWGPRERGIDRLSECAERCIDLAPHGAEGHFLFARAQQTRGDHARAVRALELAIGKNPSFAPAHALLAQTLVLTGKPDEGLARMKLAMRLDARAFVAGLAVVHFVRADYGEALEAAESALARRPHYTFGRAIAAASAWWLGDHSRARHHAVALRDLDPAFKPAMLLRTFGVDVDGVDRLVRGVEASGNF